MNAAIQGIEGILAAARDHLGLDGAAPWRLVSSRSKLGKKFFEVRENERVLIGKISDSAKAAGAFEVLAKLWNAGMRPPSRYTVVEPVAYIAEMHLLLQEKASGRQLARMLGEADAQQGVIDAARWLARLHALNVAAPDRARSADDLSRCTRELMEFVPGQARRIAEIARRVENTTAPSGRVPSHGDFHPLNVFLAPNRVTVIDVDTFTAAPREADVAYFLAQLAIQSPQPVRGLQQSFLNEYLSSSGASLNQQWISAQIAKAFVRSLHYDLCILRTRKWEMADPMLRSAEEAFDGDV